MIFGLQLHEDGFIHKLEHDVLNSYAFEMGWTPDYFIYIKTNPEECYRRIKERARETEDLIPFEYLQKLHQKHEALHQSNICPTYEIDGNQDRDEVTVDILKALEEIRTSVTQELL